MYILASTWLDAMGHWWVASLASYNNSVQYKAENTNSEADALSHINWGNSISTESLQAILNTTMVGISPLAKICVHSVWTYSNPFKMGNDWAKAQRADLDINEVIKLYQESHLDIAKLADCESKDLKLLLRQRPKLLLRNGVLYLKSNPIREDHNDMQFILPKEYQEVAL